MKKKFKIIVDKLIESYPDARCELEYKSPFQLLIATILSAQTTEFIYRISKIGRLFKIRREGASRQDKIYWII